MLVSKCFFVSSPTAVIRELVSEQTLVAGDLQINISQELLNFFKRSYKYVKTYFFYSTRTIFHIASISLMSTRTSFFMENIQNFI